MMNKNEWKKVKLGDVFELQIGRTPSRNNKNYWDNGSNNWISISDIKENEKYIEKTKEKITNLAIQDSKIKLVPKNTVIMSFKLSVGKAAITSQDIYTNEAIVAFIPKVLNLVDNNFLYYYLQNINWKDGINKAVKGLTLNKPLISNKIIFLPDLKIQKQIAKKLDTVFSILNLKKQQFFEFEKLIKFQFLKMFGDPVTNSKNQKLILLENCISKKSDLVDGPFGSSINTKVDYTDTGDIPVIRTKNVDFMTFNPKDLKFITKEKYEQIKRSQILPGDIILTKVGTIGNVCIFPNIFSEGVLSTTGSCRIRVAAHKINNIFLGYYLLYYKEKLLKIASTGVQPFLNMTHIKNIQVFNIEIELQNKFADFVRQIEKCLFALYLKESLLKSNINEVAA